VVDIDLGKRNPQYLSNLVLRSARIHGLRNGSPRENSKDLRNKISRAKRARTRRRAHSNKKISNYARAHFMYINYQLDLSKGRFQRERERERERERASERGRAVGWRRRWQRRRRPFAGLRGAGGGGNTQSSCNRLTQVGRVASRSRTRETVIGSASAYTPPSSKAFCVPAIVYFRASQASAGRPIHTDRERERERVSEWHSLARLRLCPRSGSGGLRVAPGAAEAVASTLFPSE
jgi:hypothetical protein